MNVKVMLSAVSFATLVATGVCAPTAIEAKAPAPAPAQWQGLNVGILGDSITTSRQPNRIYWQYLTSWLGWESKCYGVSGQAWKHIPAQAAKMEKEMGDEVDAILIFIGTNDYCAGRPLGEWYEEKEGNVNWWGKEVTLKQRVLSRDKETLRGMINVALEGLKKRYPDTQIVLMTPTKRGYFQFGAKNVQPAEDWPNTAGLYLDDYVKCVREAGQIWSCPVIDLFGESGHLPCTEGYSKFVRNAKSDGLHLNSLGHERLARLIYHRLSALPGTFRNCIGK